MNPLIESLLAIARPEVGTREEGGNNLGTRVKIYQAATWLPPAAWPWCAAFVAWVVMKWTVANETALEALFNVEQIALWRCRDASAFGWITWAEKHNIPVFREDKVTDAPPVLAKAGDICVLDCSHIGIVVKDQLHMDELVRTVEGNTNGKGERDSVYGDGVWLKARPGKDFIAYIRMIK